MGDTVNNIAIALCGSGWFVVVIILQDLKILNHYVEHLNLILCVNYNLI